MPNAVCRLSTKFIPGANVRRFASSTSVVPPIKMIGNAVSTKYDRLENLGFSYRGSLVLLSNLRVCGVIGNTMVALQEKSQSGYCHYYLCSWRDSTNMLQRLTPKQLKTCLSETDPALVHEGTCVYAISNSEKKLLVTLAAYDSPPTATAWISNDVIAVGYNNGVIVFVNIRTQQAIGTTGIQGRYIRSIYGYRPNPESFLVLSSTSRYSLNNQLDTFTATMPGSSHCTSQKILTAPCPNGNIIVATNGQVIVVNDPHMKQEQVISHIFTYGSTDCANQEQSTL